MPTRYLLLDFENVQPDDLSALEEPDCKVLVFVGSHQSKIPLETAMALQRLGNTAAYIQIAGSGPNALDFHIAYYIGKLAAEQKDAQFHIVSKDRGFDPLIEHLRGYGIIVTRGAEVLETPRARPRAIASPPARPARPAATRVAGARVAAARVAALKPAEAPKPALVKTASKPEPTKDPIAYIVDRLRRQGTGSPRTLKTLISSINALFDKKLTRPELEVLVGELEQQGFLRVVDAKVSYSLPE